MNMTENSASPNGNGQAQNRLTLNDDQFQHLLNMANNQATMRLDWFRSLFDPRRNIFHECGWGENTSAIDPWQYQRLYDREPIAARVVEVFPKETWQVQPQVYELEDSDDITEFEETWDVVSDGLRGDSWYKQEHGSPIWEYARRADIQSGIGRYGAIFMGLDDGKDLSQPADYRTKAKPGKPGVHRKLTMLRVLPETLARISDRDMDPKSPRFGFPLYYDLNFDDPNNTWGPFPSERNYSGEKVHWTRVLHVADNLASSEIAGVPRLQTTLNCCLDIQKVRGGSAEMYWKGALPGWALETHPQFGPEATIDPVKTKDAFEALWNGLQRYIGLPGMTAKSLAPQVVDPTPQIRVQIEAICIYLGIPIRVFMGSERGELASSQDDEAWNDRLRERQMNYVTPRLIIPLIDRLIALGVLPIPSASQGKVIVNRTRIINGNAYSAPLEKSTTTGYCIEWPDLKSQSDQEKADVLAKRTGALVQYADSGLPNVMAPMDYFTREASYTEEEAQAIIENAEEHQEEQLDKDIDKQHTMIDEGLQNDPTEPTPGEALKAEAVKEGAKAATKSGGAKGGKNGAGKPLGAANSFCPTGQGGGVDPTCSPGSRTTSKGETLVPLKREGKSWVNQDGRSITPHLKKLGIPPAWKDVYANSDPNGDLLATGVDAKGRAQYKYGDTHNANAAAAKFGRVRELLKKREGIFKELDRDAKSPELKDKAECLKVVMQTGMRPGSDGDTKADHKSYGATTLEGRHVVANSDGSVFLRLVTGKNKGREVEFPIKDKSTSDMLKSRAANVGESGRIFDISAEDLRSYSKDKDGGGFKTKDHRTALGTEVAIRELKDRSPPTSVKGYKAAVKEVATEVARTLGNTPAIALKSYIDPNVFTGWRKAAGA